MPLKLLALLVPLSLDTFAVSTALGVAGLSDRERWRITLLMAGFEAVMPVAGFLVGSVVSGPLGGIADYLAAAILVGAGALMLRSGGEGEGDELAERMRGLSAIGVGLSVSVDELAIGLAIGLLGLPILVVVLLIAAQALLAGQLGARLGARLGKEVGEGAERLAGLLLVLFGLALAVASLSGHPL
jgi:putative Mn2+ efflux pump MntP